MLEGNNNWQQQKIAGNSLVISIAMRMRQCNVRRIAQWGTSRLLRSHWMPSSGECLRPIAPAAAVVDNFE
jgi:hypothetical protein